MPSEKSYVKVCSDQTKDAKPLQAKPLSEASRTIDVEDGGDVYLVLENVRYQLHQQKSPFFDGIEYVYKGILTKGTQICFVHKDGRKIPVHEASDCGYTLVGKARKYFEAKRALCANGEASDDQEYVYVNQNSTLYYTGETEEHSLFIRIYDNLNGVDNDRWVVIYIV